MILCFLVHRVPPGFKKKYLLKSKYSSKKTVKTRQSREVG